MLRALQQTASGSGRSQFAYVTTVEELQAALSAGVRHVEITEHLDLTPYDTAFIEDVLIKLRVNNATWSIRVCSSGSWCSARDSLTVQEKERSSQAAASTDNYGW
jgi:hypothetical protein